MEKSDSKKNVIKVQSVSEATARETDPLDIVMEFCYYYPAYTFRAARSIPFKDMVRGLKVARRMQARDYLNQVNIAAAPHTEKGKGVKQLQSRYKELIEE